MSLVEKIRVSFYIEHPNVSDLGVRLLSPGEGEFSSSIAISDLSDANFGSGTADALRTTLDDTTSGDIQTAPGPRVGTFLSRSGNGLAIFVGSVAEGTWSIIVRDFSAGNTGTLHAASMFMTVDGVETRYDAVGLPLAIPDEDFDGIVVPFALAEIPDPPWEPSDDGAAYEVRITPLFRPVAGLDPDLDEETSTSSADGLIIAIDEEDTILVEQFADLEVEHKHNEGRTGRVTISMHNPILDTPPFAIAEYQCALWIGLRRPGESIAEGILYGQCNVIDNFDGDWGTVVLEASDPFIGKATHHYIRRGDLALNIDSERGQITQDQYGISALLHAARNIGSQMARQMPALALDEHMVNDEAPNGPPLDIERGQEVADSIKGIVRAGPDIDIVPSWAWPATCYATMWMYEAPGDPEAPSATQIGRNLDPADPDAPAAGEVIFERGVGQDNLASCRREPGRPATHVHVLDDSRKYRITAVDVESSGLVGSFVDWIGARLTIRRPARDPLTGDVAPADTSALAAIGEAHIKAYGKPPPFVTMTLRAIDMPGMPQYGHPGWAAAMPGSDPGGRYYMGDYVRVRAAEGHRSFSELVRIDTARFTMAQSNGLPMVQIEAVPAIGGSLGDPGDEG